jgi:hypothetical protein
MHGRDSQLPRSIQLASAIQVGDRIAVYGVLPMAEPMIAAVVIEAANGTRVEDSGLPTRSCRAQKPNAESKDSLLLKARAPARGLRPATYVAVLLRSHLRGLSPLPKDELLALRCAVSELGALTRELHRIAHVLGQEGRAAADADA